jgi:GntR family transcriptional regulator
VDPISHRTVTRDARAEPLYQQVAEAITEEIARGSWRPHQRMPAERELCQQFHVSRVTLRRALGSLVDDGLLVSSHGRGWFVTGGPISEPPNTLESFSSLAKARGLRSSSIVLAADVRLATLQEAEALGIAAGEQLLDLQRIRLIEDIPTALDHNRVALRHAPGLEAFDFTTVSLYATLEERFGIVPSWAEYSLTASAASAREAELLDTTEGSPLLVGEHTTHDADDTPVELGRQMFRPDRYRFRATLVRR